MAEVTPPEGHHGHDHSSSGSAHSVKDPVCGMSVEPDKTDHHARHDGRDYHFCAAGCRLPDAAPNLLATPNIIFPVRI